MTTPAIEITDLAKHFARPLPALRRLLKRKGPDVVHALRGVSLSIGQGEVFGLVGRNGQGKTTLIKSTCGLIEPSAGTVRVLGFDSVKQTLDIKRRVGLVNADERSFYFRLTGEQNLLFFARLLGLTDGEAQLRMRSLVPELELDDAIGRPFQEYSSGNKQRLSIARALLVDPPLLLLDEPTRSLDPISAQALRGTIRRWAARDLARTVLITTHNLGEVEALCARVAILSRGRVIECAPLEALRQKYASSERVTLRVSGEFDSAWLAARQAELTSLEARAEEGVHALVLTRKMGDDQLHRLLQACVASSLQIVSCDTEHFGLMQVLEQIEAREVRP
jgi:ABC-2 type transport system ATP-binding protein